MGAWNSGLWQKLAGLASWLPQVHSLVVLWFPRMAEPRGREGWASGRGWSHNWGAEGQLMLSPQPPLPRSYFLERRAHPRVLAAWSPCPVHLFSFSEQR